MSAGVRSSRRTAGLPVSPAAAWARTAAAAAVATAVLPWPAAAGSLQTRDPDGNAWSVVEDPADGQDDYLLRRDDPTRHPAPNFGRQGVTVFTLGPENDSPVSLRVEASGRVWMVGTSTSAGKPQPVVARFLPDGSPDTRWGVQGRNSAMPMASQIRANDLLPLSDGSVLVAGEAPGGSGAKAVVYHLLPDGSVDQAFGERGLWTRPGQESAVAATLAVGADGGVVVGVSVRAGKPFGEVWTLYEKPSQLLSRDDLEDGIDEDELHVEWVGRHWQWLTQAGVRGLVPPATLAKPAAAIASAPNDPGQGAFNPFTGDHPAAVAPPVPAPPEEDSTPWGWIAAIVAVALGLLGFVLTRGKNTSQAPSRR